AGAGVHGTAGLRGGPVAQCRRRRIIIGDRLLRRGGRQRFQIDRDGVVIAVGQVRRGVVDGLSHRSKGGADAVMALLEKLGDVFFRPSTETGPHVAAQARSIPSVERRPCEIARAAVVERLFLNTDAARGMAGAAMAGALDQIGAAIPRGVMARFRDIAATWGVKVIPDRERPAWAEECWNLTFPICLMDGRYLLHEKPEEHRHVRVGKFGVGGIWHSWIEVATVLGDSLPHGAFKIG